MIADTEILPPAASDLEALVHVDLHARQAGHVVARLEVTGELALGRVLGRPDAQPEVHEHQDEEAEAETRQGVAREWRWPDAG